MENSRKKRVQCLKKIIIAIVVTLLVFPSIFCVVLTFKIGKLERQIEELRTGNCKSLEIVWNEEEAFSEGMVLGEDTSGQEDPKEGLKKVYLTFDDGPSIYTKDILDVLKRYNVKATFFVTGMNSEQYGDYYQEILDDGHSLGIHTYSHVYNDVYESLDSFIEDFEKMRNLIYEKTGEKITLYRFPGGSGNNVVSPKVREEIFAWLEKEGIQYYDWNVSSGDAEKQVSSPQRIAQNCIDGVKNCNTAIVLLHDAGGKKSTIEALPLIIEGINQLDDNILLPMDEETVKIQQIKATNE